MNKRRVVVTGLGLVTPVGIGVSDSWKNIIEGQSGISNITKFDPNSFASNFSSTIAGEVKNFDPKEYLNPKDVRRMDTFIQFGLVAAHEAFNDSVKNGAIVKTILHILFEIGSSFRGFFRIQLDFDVAM